MTLIAAYKIHDITILMGDFLLTDDTTRKKHIFIPTKPELSEVKPESGKRRIAGFRKKVHIINELFAVGFTGYLQPGKAILNELDRKYSNRAPGFNDLKSTLIKIKCDYKDKAEIAGWICKNRPICFHWRGDQPKYLFVRDSVFTGSGGEHFKELLSDQDFSGLSQQIKTSYEKAIFKGLVKSGKVLMTELSTGTNLDEYYGFGTEIIFWNGSKLEYNKKLSYVFWNIIIEETNNLRVMPANICCTYQNFSEFSVIQTTHLGLKKNGQGFEAKNTYVMAVTPIHDEMKDLDVRKRVGRLKIDSEYLFTGIHVHNPKNNLTGRITFINKQGDDFVLSKVENNYIQINIRQIHDLIPKQLFN